MLRLAALCLLPSSLALCATTRLPRVPQSPQEMMQQAARAVSRGVAAGALRQTVKIVVPDDQRTYKVFGEVSAPGFGEIQGTSAPEDLDPWPGGLLQQYPIALDLGKQMLMQVTGASERGMSDQVLNSEDGCGLILAQGGTPSEDAACVLFAGTDQLDDLAKVGADGEKRSLAAAATHRPASPPRRLRPALCFPPAQVSLPSTLYPLTTQVDQMASGRLLCLLNPQFRRVEDFSLWQRGKAKATYFEQGYEVGYAFEEFACRGEDVKLVGERGSGCTARQASAAAQPAAPQRARRLRMAPAPTQSTTLPLPPPRSLEAPRDPFAASPAGTAWAGEPLWCWTMPTRRACLCTKAASRSGQSTPGSRRRLTRTTRSRDGLASWARWTRRDSASCEGPKAAATRSKPGLLCAYF